MLLDHIVHFVGKSPQEASEFWRQKGYHAIAGGQHLNWGTYNALLYTKDCYIEWLALENPEVAKSADHPLVDLFLHDKRGFGTICLRTDSIAQVNERLLTEGIETSGVLDAERRTGNGDLIRWKLLFIKEAVSDRLPSPFFIEWEEGDETRYESLRSTGAITPANENTEIEACVFGVQNIESSEEKWRMILGGTLQLDNCRLEFQKAEQLKERLEQVRFKGGTQKLVFEEGVYYMPPSGNNKEG